jgi:hypothetical protein
MKGLKAVHVVLYNPKTQKESCLYVLPDVDAMQSLEDVRMRMDQGRLAVWHDQGRLFALYDPSQP